MIVPLLIGITSGIVLMVENMKSIILIPITAGICVAYAVLNRNSLRYRYKSKVWFRKFFAMLFGIIWGIISVHLIDLSAANSIAACSGTTVDLLAKISSIKESPKRFELILSNISIKDGDTTTKKSGKLKMMVPLEYLTIIDGIDEKDVIGVKLALAEPEFGDNHNDPKYAFLNLSKGIHATAWADSGTTMHIVAKDKSLTGRFIKYVKTKVKALISDNVETDKKAILQAILFGESELLDENVLYAFQRTGFSHVLSVSGLHISSLIALILLVLSIFPVKRTLSDILLLLIILTYVSLTHFGVSVIRVLIYLILSLLIKRVTINSSRLKTFLLALSIHLLLFPLHLYNIGFQFSYICVFTLMFIAPTNVGNKEKNIADKKITKRIPGAILVSILLQLATLPLVISLNNEVFIFSWIINLFLVPIVGILVPLAILGIIVGFIHPILALIPLELSLQLSEVIKNVVLRVSNLNFGFCTIATPKKSHIILYYAVFLLIAALLKNRAFFYELSFILRRNLKKVKLVLLSIAVAFLINKAIDYRSMSIDFINVGNGDAALICAPFGKTILIDGGDKSLYKDYGQSVVAPFLKSRGIKVIDMLIMSHGHSDHIGGLIYILKNFRVGALFISLNEPINELSKALIEAALSKDIPVYRVGFGSRLAFYDFEMLFMNPHEGIIQSENDASLVVKLNYRGKTAIFTGDVEINAEDDMIKAIPQNLLESDILKVSHHGSDTSSNETFLDVISPSYAVISVGKNKYSHPSAEVLKRLYEREIMTYRTDQNGTISFRYAFGKLKISVSQINLNRIPLFRVLEKENL